MKLLNRLIKHELISGSFYIFVGSTIANLSAFFLNLFMARSLSYPDYAIFASLLSLITLASIPATSINTIVVKFATGYFVKKENDKLKTLYFVFLKFISAFSLTLVVFFIVLAVPIKNFLHIDDIWYIFITAFVIALFYLNTLNVAFLQSLLKFGFLSFTTALAGIVKILFGIILVMLGYKAFGGLWAIFIMTFVSFLFGYIPLRKILKEKNRNIKIYLQTKEIVSYSVPAFITILFLASFTSTDVILAKHFFNPHLAGFYAGLSLMGKVIFYFTIPIPMVMFPLLVKRHTANKNFVSLFYLALVLVMLPSVAITAFYFVFPEFAIKLFLGGRDYLYLAKYLGVFGLYLTVFSMVNVCANFFLSLNQTKIVIPVVLAALSQILLIYIFHSNFYEVIGVSLLVCTLLFVFLLFLFIKNYGNLGKLKESIAFLNSPNI